MTQAEEICNAIGEEAMVKLCSAFGGEKIYVPKRVPITNRDTRIKEEFVSHLHEGATCMAAYDMVAHQYNLSTRRVQMVVAG